MVGENVLTNFNTRVSQPEIDPSTYVHPLASVIGRVILGKNIMVSPMASVRGDEGQPLFIGDDSNVQDGVIIHALETEIDGIPVHGRRREICRLCGKKGFTRPSGSYTWSGRGA